MRHGLRTNLCALCRPAFRINYFTSNGSPRRNLRRMRSGKRVEDILAHTRIARDGTPLESQILRSPRLSQDDKRWLPVGVHTELRFQFFELIDVPFARGMDVLGFGDEA